MLDILADIKAKVSEVSKAVGAKELDGAKVKSLIDDINGKIQDVDTKYADVEAESIRRKEKIRSWAKDRDDDKDRIDELEGDKTALTKKLTTATDDTELKELRGYRAEMIKTQTEGFINRLNAIKGHDSFEKAKVEFKLPEPDKEGNYDFSKTEESDITHNINAMTRLDNLEYFGKTKKVDAFSKKSTTENTSFEDKVGGAKTLKELETIRDEQV